MKDKNHSVLVISLFYYCNIDFYYLGFDLFTYINKDLVLLSSCKFNRYHSSLSFFYFLIVFLILASLIL